MRVVIAGGHGKIALRLARLLVSDGHQAAGLIRNPDHAADLRDAGAEPVPMDLEQAEADEVTEVLRGADAVVFAAGAGPGSGVERKDTVDRAASGLLADAAERAGIQRYLQISAMGLGRAGDPAAGEVFAAYLRAKAKAEEDLRARDLDWTIIRPGRLTDEPGTGEVHLAESLPYDEISRDDVAAVLAALLTDDSVPPGMPTHPTGSGLTLELTAGHTPIAEAISRLGP